MRSNRVIGLLPAAVFLVAIPVSVISADSRGPVADSQVLTDGPLEPHTRDLLDLGFRMASALPENPHVKTKARTQEKVVAACLELEQPDRALEYAMQIPNWRRGACLGDLSYYFVSRNQEVLARRFLDMAREEADGMKLADESNPDGEQPWRKHRILAKVARTHAWLGEKATAGKIIAGLEASVLTELGQSRAQLMEEEDFDAEVKSLDAVLETGGFDQVKPALAACAELFDRFYEDEVRRDMMEERVKKTWKQVPAMVRIEFLMELVNTAVRRDDGDKALELARETQRVAESSRWVAEDHIALTARLAELFWTAGDHDKARTEAEVARLMYEAEKDKIVDIFRAEALLPLAEAYHTMGDATAAQDTYEVVVAESVRNPNSRPRVEDLTAACLSMAVRGVRPETALMSRLEEEFSKLGDPW